MTDSVSNNSWWSCWCSNKARVAICFSLILLAVIFDIIGFSVPYWYCVEVGGTKMYEGLWKVCSETGGVLTCRVWVNEDDVPAWFVANQAMQTIGMILLVVALALLIVLVLFYHGNKGIKIAVLVLLIAAAVFILIGAIIYGAESDDMVSSNLDFGFAFVIVAAILAIIGSICLCIGMHNHWDEDEEEE